MLVQALTQHFRSYFDSAENHTLALWFDPEREYKALLPHLTGVTISDAGLFEFRGKTYRLPSETAGKVVKAGDALAAVQEYIRVHGRITRREVMTLWNLTAKQAEYWLKQWVQGGELQLVGSGRSAHYTTVKTAETPEKGSVNSEFGV